jgi:membrane protein YdbS with pleckstrin-like domain
MISQKRNNNENEIHIRKGIITVETDMIPFYRIQNIEVIEGFIMRKYKL